MTPSARLRFDPATPLIWRLDGSLQIGFNDYPASGPILVVTHPKEVAIWLALLDGSREPADLIKSGQALGLAESAVRDLLSELLAAGHVQEVAVLSGGQQPAARTLDLKYAAALKGIGLADLTEQRQSQQLLLVGAGAIAAATAAELRRQLVKVGWEPSNPARIRDEDAALAELEPKLVGKTWASQTTRVSQPQLVIVFADTHDPQWLESRYIDCTVLPVTVHKHRIAVGPLLGERSARCPRCLLLARTQNDADWNFALTQLLHRRRPLPTIGEPWFGLALKQLVAIALQLLESTSIPLLADHSLELLPPDPIWQWRPWPAISDCECNSAAGDDLQEIVAEVVEPTSSETVDFRELIQAARLKLSQSAQTEIAD